MGTRTIVTRLAALVTGAALVFSVIAISQSTATASGEFVDDDGSPHEWAIQAIAELGITNGCGPSIFCPEAPLTREQLATFFVRAFELTESRPSGFADIAASPHRQDIEKLAAAGITVGCEADAFCPTEEVTRAQIATFLTRALELDPIEWRNTFRDDDGMIDEPNIEALADEGVTQGCGSNTYCPSAKVKRGEMASLLARSMKLKRGETVVAESDPATTAAPVTTSTAAAVTTSTAAAVTTSTAAAVTTSTAAAVTTSTAAPVTTSTAAAVTTSTAAPVTTTTAAPVTTTTVAPVTTTTAAPRPSSGFPDASSTGVPAGVSLRSSGSMTVSTAGAVIDGYDISGSLWINASNVTVRNTRVRSTDWVVIRVKSGVTGVVIENCEVDGGGRSGVEGQFGIYGPVTVRGCEISGVTDGVVPDSGSLVEGNYIHGLLSPGSPHYDGIQIDGGISNVVIRGNNIINSYGQTSAVMIDNWFGPIRNILVDGNRLVGGGYTVYSDGQFSGGSISGVSFVNNRLGKGYWGYASIVNNTVTSSGNVDDATGQPVTLR